MYKGTRYQVVIFRVAYIEKNSRNFFRVGLNFSFYCVSGRRGIISCIGLYRDQIAMNARRGFNGHESIAS